jgi:hypothetical protein
MIAGLGVYEYRQTQSQLLCIQQGHVSLNYRLSFKALNPFLSRGLRQLGPLTRICDQ